MDDKDRGATTTPPNNGEAGEGRRERRHDDFARSMARAEFRRFYWNDQLENDLWQSLEQARQRVRKRERELKKANAGERKRRLP